MLLRELRQGQRQAERRERIAAPPCGVRGRLMAIETVRPEHDLLHERDVTGRHVEVAPLAGERAGHGQDRHVHEQRIAPAAVQRHELTELAVLGEAAGRRAQHQRLRAIVAGLARVLEEQQMRRERGLRRTREAVLRAVEVGRQQARDLVPFAESQPADERHGGDVGRLRELVSVDARQFLGERSRRSRQPAVELLVRVRDGDACREGLQESRRGIDPPCWDPADVDDDVLRQRFHESRIGPGDQDQVGCVCADPSPQHVRFDLLAVRNA